MNIYNSIIVILTITSLLVITKLMYPIKNYGFGIKRRNQRIDMLPIFTTKKYFFKNLLDILNRLEDNNTYKMITHDKIIKKINKYVSEGKCSVNLIYDKSKYKKRILWEAILLLNFKEIGEPVKFYEVEIVKK